MADSPTVARELARREVGRHRDLIVGLTTSQPSYQQFNGLSEFVVDLRLGADPKSPIIRNVVVAASAVGVVTDMGLPVLVERSEAGQLTVVGRSDIGLPDVSVRSYTLYELGFGFMTGLKQDAFGAWRDGYGYAMPDPTIAVGNEVGYEWEQRFLAWGEKDLGSFNLGEVVNDWQQV